MEITVRESKLPDVPDSAGIKAQVEAIMRNGTETVVAAFIDEREDGLFRVVMEVDDETAESLLNQGTTPAEKFGQYVSAIMDKLRGGGAGGNLSLGSLSAKYESNGKPGAIGFDNGGGWSYGAYQFASLTGSVQEFLNFLAGANPGFAADLNAAGGDAGARAGTEEFKNAWKKLAADHSDEFLGLQHAFIKKNFYDKFVSRVQGQINLDVNNRSLAVQNAAWSTAVQHGPANNVFKNALTNVQIADGRPGDETIINAVYAERSKVETYFTKVPELHANLKERFTKEKTDALNMLT